MTPSEAAQQILQHANAAGLSPKDWADKFNKFNPKRHTQRGPMTFDPTSIKPPVELMAERMKSLQTHHYVDYTFFARWGACQAAQALRHQWPEWIKREPTAEDANEDGWVQTLSEGCIDLTDFRHTNGRPWLHTPGWRPKPEPTPMTFEQELKPGIAITMLPIPAGSFLMGSPEGEPDRFDDEGPQHEVTLGAFWMAQTPTTQAQWRTVAGWPKVELDLEPDPSCFKGDRRPVGLVSWRDAQEFCRRLSQRTGQRYGLPSEAQWEYACRAGSSTPFYFGATLTPEQANCKDSETVEVASHPANAWGLHDMHGNVWEWCQDHWHSNYEGAPNDGSAWEYCSLGGVQRLLRGGSWINHPRICRSAYRLNYPPDDRYYGIGFRVCCLPQD